MRKIALSVVAAVGQFDSFLKREIPKIQSSPAFGPNSVVFVTYDEGGTSRSPTATPRCSP